MGFTIDFSVLNQKGTPALYSDIFANRPAAGYQGRLFIATDTAAIYEDTGTAWTLIANVSSGAGTLQQVTTNGNTSNVGISVTAGGVSTNSLTDTSLTTGSVPFAGAGGLISQDNANLFWDDTNNRLGINTNTPGNSLDVHTSSSNPTIAVNNTAALQSAISFLNTSIAKWRIGNTAINSFDIYNFTLAAYAMTINNASNAVVMSGTLNANEFNLQPTGYSLLASLSRNLTGAGYGVLSLRNSANGTIQPSSLTVDRTYTLPDATGTIALTSDLASYLPLAGGTLTGALGGTTANFSSNITIGGNDSVSTRLYVRTENNANNPALVAFKNITSISTEDVFRVQSWNGALNTVASIQANGSSVFSGDLSLTSGTTRNLNFYNNTAVNINAQIQYSEVNANTGQLLFKTNNAGTLANRLTISNTGSATFESDLTTKGQLFVGNTSTAVAQTTTYQNSNNGYKFGINAACTLFEFTNGGPAVIATINGATGVYTPLSDINKKKDFEDSTIGLNAILNLKPTLYRFKDNDENLDKDLGFIAQEVKEFIPQAYVESGENENKFIGLNYNPITAALVKAIQEQQTIINGLLQRIEFLENK